MKIRFKLKGLQVEVKELPHGISVKIENMNHRPAESRSVSPLLEQRINGCKSMRELLELLFTTPNKTEATMALFDLKMEALEKEEGFTIHQPFKSNNNGSTSFGKLA